MERTRLQSSESRHLRWWHLVSLGVIAVALTGAGAALAFDLGGLIDRNPVACLPGRAVNDISISSCKGYRDNSLIVHITGSAPSAGQIIIEYGNDEAGWFRTAPYPVEDGRFEAHVLRLRPESTYDFRLLHESEGTVVAGPSGSFTTGPLPKALQRADIRATGEREGLVLLDFNLQKWEDAPAFGGLAAIDSAGEIVWYVETKSDSAGDVLTQKPNGNIVYIPPTYGIVEITPLGEQVAGLEAPCPERHPFHHEIIALDEHRLLFLSREHRDVFGNPELLQEGDTIWIWDQQTGEAREVWSIFDHVDPRIVRTPSSDIMEGYMWRGCSGEEPAQDWSHGNAVKPAPDGSFIFSARHLDQVMSIAPDFSRVNWRLGGVNSDFTFEDPDDAFSHQHSAWQLENGNILLFDNGNGKDGKARYSRAIELELDFETMTARKVWEYRHQPDLFAECCSSVERLPNGNTLVVFGSGPAIEPCCHTFTIVEADREGNAVWTAEISAPGKMVQYRGYHAVSIMGETPLDR